MSKQDEIKGLIEDLRSTPNASLSREGCLILANLIEEQQEEIEVLQKNYLWISNKLNKVIDA